MMRRDAPSPDHNPSFLPLLGDPMVELQRRRATEGGFGFRTLWDVGFPFSFGADAPGYYPVDPLCDLGPAAHRTLSACEAPRGGAHHARGPAAPDG